MAVAQSIIDGGAWCVVEACLDAPRQHWEPRVLICKHAPAAVADAVETEIAREPGCDLRLVGRDRRTLRPAPELGAVLCHVAAPSSAGAAPAPEQRELPAASSEPTLVRDAMNPIVVTVGPQDTLREAARRMTARSVGAAVVMQDGPAILTERDILRSNGVGHDIDAELVGDHATTHLVHAAADWSLEQAAQAMVRGAFRHVVVLDGSDVVGILSMRDIVRCWTREGAGRFAEAAG